MSDYVWQNSSYCSFKSNESWAVLSYIERSIEKKVAAIGYPLKDTDIQIYRGVLTGCNDAFIIDDTTRSNILNNCMTSDERIKTEELIRPILRGRDIKRYGYSWPELWIIATFPSKKYDINDYPAVKEYLLSFGKDRLEQSGMTHIINGEKVKARKKTNNKWFETQDSINYWDELSKPKIIWGEISDRSKFCLDSTGNYYPEATTFMMTGKDLDILLCFLNSKLAEYIFSLIGTTTGVGTVRWKKFKLEQLYVPLNLNEKMKSEMRGLLAQIVNNKIKPIDHYISENKLDALIYNIYNLSLEEVQFIEERAKLIRNDL